METNKGNGRKSMLVVVGLCLFIAALTFKPSEPYLSQYLICNYETAKEICSAESSQSSCVSNSFCLWSSSCGVRPCSNVTLGQCGNDEFNYCTNDHSNCDDMKCYKSFTENQVNNDIYPWSTYAYLPFLLVLGPFAELFSYQFAILFGILGRVATRFLLLYGNSLLEMQLMQVVYSLGTAAEDVFSAYVYYIVSVEDYQTATSAIKAAALISSLAAGIAGDILVVEYSSSLRLLMWISAAFVWFGFFVGLFVIRPTTTTLSSSNSTINKLDAIHEDDVSGAGGAYSIIDSQEQHTENAIQSPLRSQQEQDHEEDQDDTTTMFDRSPLFTHTVSMRADDNIVGYAAGVSPERSSSSTNNVHSQQQLPPQSPLASLPINIINNKRKTKLQIFYQQIDCLRVALQSKAMQAMLLLWVFGNAVFTTLYDYEVSVYEELQGNNNWNGSVLAIMLLAGSFGALLPAKIKWPKFLCFFCRSENNNNDVHDDGEVLLNRLDSELIISMRLMTAAILSSIVLVFFALSWSLIPSITCLALFFATWQYINVIVYARFALHLKLAESQVRLKTTNNSSNAGRRRGASDEMYSPVVTSMPTVLRGFLDMDSEDDEEGAWKGDQPSRIPINDGKFRAKPARPNYRSNSNNSNDNSRRRRESRQKEQNEPAVERDENEVDPPYSLAIVLIIACNVVVQIIIQSLLFSFLQSTLQFACWVMVLLFVATSAMYILVSVGWFGASSYYYEIRKWLRYSAPCACVRSMC